MRAAGLLVSVGVLLLVCAAGIAVGAKSIPLGDVWHGLFHDSGTGNDVIVVDVRLPRTLLGLLVGAALGLAGAVMQALTRNPLAEPGLLGVNAGAAAAVVSAISFFGVTSISGYVWFAFAGAAIVSVAVYALGGSRAPPPYGSRSPVPPPRRRSTATSTPCNCWTRRHSTGCASGPWGPWRPPTCRQSARYGPSSPSASCSHC